MIRLNPDVRLGLCPEIVLALVIAQGVYQEIGGGQAGGADVVVTSATDGTHLAPNHCHYRGRAVDLRVRHVPRERWESLRNGIAGWLGGEFFVQLEFAATPGSTGDHLHIEYTGHVRTDDLAQFPTGTHA